MPPVFLASQQQIDVPVSVLMEPRQSLAHCAAALRQSATLDRITGRNLLLRSATEQLAAYLTTEFPDIEGGQLLQNALDAGCAAYSQAIEAGARMVDQDRAFLRGLVVTAASAIEYRVYGLEPTSAAKPDGATHYWETFQEPLRDWVMRHRVDRIVFQPRSGVNEEEGAAAKIQLAARLLGVAGSAEFLRLIQGGGHVA